jgi:hypothetical protein
MTDEGGLPLTEFTTKMIQPPSIRETPPVTFRYDDDDIDYEPAPKRRRIPWSTIIVIIGLATTGVTSAFLWRSYFGANPHGGSIFSSGSGSDTADKGPGLKDLQALQQQSASQMQAALQLLTAQQAETKRLADQIAALVGKVDALQHVINAPPAPPAPPIQRAAVPPARKPPPTANPTRPSPSAPVQITPPAPNNHP